MESVEAASARPSHRYIELDGLRGLAVAAVIGFHYLSRFDALFPGYDAAPFTFVIGQYGVHLFFLISGYVILMTVRRSHRPSDFAIARATRLYPTYLACLMVTIVVVALARLPGRVTSPVVLLANVSMLQSLVQIQSVDGAYWSLGIEAVFYGFMWVLMMRTRVESSTVRIFAVAWTSLGLAVALASKIRMPSRLLVAVQLATLSNYAWLFALGMLMLLSRENAKLERWAPLVLAIGIASQGLAHSWSSALVVGIIGFFFILITSAEGVPLLRLRPLQFLGAVSYPLYLIHQNIGYVVMRELISKVGRIASMVTAVAVCLVLATIVHRTIEGTVSRSARTAAIALRNRLVGAPAA